MEPRHRSGWRWEDLVYKLFAGILPGDEDVLCDPTPSVREVLLENNIMGGSANVVGGVSVL